MDCVGNAVLSFEINPRRKVHELVLHNTLNAQRFSWILIQNQSSTPTSAPSVLVPSVIWRCWLGGKKSIRLVKNWVVGCWRGWRRGVMVSGVRQWTKLTHVGPGYNWDGWPSWGGYTISGCNQPTRSTQPCIPPGSLNRVPASAGVKAGMSPLPGGR